MRGMVRVHRGLAAACVACCLLVLGVAGGLVAADRDARVITPSGSPIWLDPWRALLFDSPAVVVMLENRHSAPVTSALRLWMFDAALRLKGSVDYCTIEVLDRNTRGHVFVPLDIADVSRARSCCCHRRRRGVRAQCVEAPGERSRPAGGGAGSGERLARAPGVRARGRIEGCVGLPVRPAGRRGDVRPALRRHRAGQAWSLAAAEHRLRGLVHMRVACGQVWPESMRARPCRRGHVRDEIDGARGGPRRLGHDGRAPHHHGGLPRPRPVTRYIANVPSQWPPS